MADNSSIRVLGISGSLRKGSLNQLLVHAAKEGAPDGIEVIEQSLRGLPLYDPDLEAQGGNEAVEQFKSAVASADALLISTPEYCFGVSAALKSALEWAALPARQSPLEGKPVAIMGASSDSSGTLRAQLHLREILLYTHSPVVTRPEVLVPRAQTRFSEQGYLSDEATRGNVRMLLEALRDLVLHMRSAIS